MIIGISFIIIGVFIYIEVNYDIKYIDGDRVFSKKKDVEKNIIYRYKILTSIFATILGIFKILSSIIY